MNWQSVGMISGAALLGLSTLQVLTAAYKIRSRALATQSRYLSQRSLFDQQLESVFNWARAVKPIFKSWSGCRQFHVAAVVDEALDCKSFYLVPEDGRPLPRFEPGQYLTFELPGSNNDEPVVRCYSLSDRPREDYYRVTIKRVGRPINEPSLPEGQGSGYFHREVQAGTSLAVRAPQGAFFLDPRDDVPLVLVGGGIGITPIMSMVGSIVHDRSERTTYVFGGFRNSREHPFHESLSEIKQSHENLRFDVSYSRPMPGDVLGRDYDHRGYVDVSRLREVLPSSNFRFYICGPPAMMETLVPALLGWGVPDDHIYFEAFGPASVRKLGSGAATEPHSVKFTRTKKDVLWTGKNISLLELAESNGIRLESGCRAGNCGQCLTTVQSGRITHIKRPGIPVGEKECLACIAVPEDDLILEA